MERIALYGCGNMGGAMLAGWLAGGIQPERLTIISRSLATAPAGVELLRQWPAEREFDAVVLGIKPQGLVDALPLIAPHIGPQTMVLSLLVGVKLDTLTSAFPAARAVVRVMPNLAAALGKSPIGLAARGLDAQGVAALNAVLRPLGTPEWVDEALFDAVGALAGSGPAFAYRFIDALGAAGAVLGLPAEQAQRLALQTMEGAVLLAAASPYPPAELARRVASPGGTTQKGLDVLDNDDALYALLARTLAASRDRSIELGRQIAGA